MVPLKVHGGHHTWFQFYFRINFGATCGNEFLVIMEIFRTEILTMLPTFWIAFFFMFGTVVEAGIEKCMRTIGMPIITLWVANSTSFRTIHGDRFEFLCLL